MKSISVVLVGCWMLGLAGFSYGASARCEVVKKDGNILVMDCGKQSEGFKEKSRVKIKTDRDKK